MSQHELIQGIHDRMSAYVLLTVEKQIEKLIDLDGDTDRHEHSLQTENENPTSEISNVQQNTVCFCETPQSATLLTQNRVPLKDTETTYTLTQSEIPCEPEMDNTDEYTYSYNTAQNSYNTTQNDYSTNQRSQYQQPPYQETIESLIGQPPYYQTSSNNNRKKKSFLRLSNLINLVN